MLIADVVRQVQAREAEGVLEVVLTGTQLGNYGVPGLAAPGGQGPRRLLTEQKRPQEVVVVAPAGPTEVELLTEIRDSLRAR